MRRRFAHRAFSYVELVLATVIMGGGLVATMTLMGTVAKSQKITMDRRSATHLAYSFLEEILSYPYSAADAGDTLDGVQVKFDVDTGDLRLEKAAYVSVDDFDGCDCLPPCATDGSELSDLDKVRRFVTVEMVEAADLDQVTGGDEGVKRITVVVEVDEKEQARAVGFKTRHR